MWETLVMLIDFLNRVLRQHGPCKYQQKCWLMSAEQGIVNYTSSSKVWAVNFWVG